MTLKFSSVFINCVVYYEVIHYTTGIISLLILNEVHDWTIYV